MDQGIAALLGATVGVLGTISTSAITGWSSRQQVRTQARVDHAHWRRQVRREAYSAFLTPAHGAHDALRRAARALIGNTNTEEADHQLQVAQEKMGLVQATWAVLAVEGPETVEQAANKVKTALHSMHTTLLAWRDSVGASDLNVKYVERHAVEVTKVSERISAVATAARAALDEAAFPTDTNLP
ncbi:hypothetical protein [Streptomyces canus]|uniref:hypothetical protein n=1 Tax=Streptomyces canus TaxID=58343 RepID=UPI002E2903CB|nr:hypothetical protein [Streptomyces canus]